MTLARTLKARESLAVRVPWLRYSNGQWGTGVRVEGSRGEGQSQAQSVTHRQGVIEAGQAVQLQGAGDVILKGGVIKAAQVSAEVGGRLHIESLQDTQSYGGHQDSVSLGATVSPGSTVWAARIGEFPCKINHLRVIF